MSDHRTEWVFARFTAAFGARWTTPLDADDALDAALEVWGRALAALTPEQVRQGVAAVEAEPDDWPPSVATFLRLALGLPSLEVGAANAARMSGDPLSREIRTQAGSPRVRMASANEAERICQAAYRDLLRRFNEEILAGRPVEPVTFLHHAREQRRQIALQPNRSGEMAVAGDVIPKHLQGVA